MPRQTFTLPLGHPGRKVSHCGEGIDEIPPRDRGVTDVFNMGMNALDEGRVLVLAIYPGPPINSREDIGRHRTTNSVFETGTI